MEPGATSHDADVLPPQSGSQSRNKRDIDRVAEEASSATRELGSDGMPARKRGRVGSNAGSHNSTGSSVRHPGARRTSREQRTKHVKAKHGQREVDSLLRLSVLPYENVDGSEASTESRIISGASHVANRDNTTARSAREGTTDMSTTPNQPGETNNDSRTGKLESWLHDVSRETELRRGSAHGSGSRDPFPTIRTTSGTTIGHVCPVVSSSQIVEYNQSQNQRGSNESLISTDTGEGLCLPYDAVSVPQSPYVELNRRMSPPFDPSFHQHPGKQQMASVYQTPSGIMRTKKAAPRSVSFDELPSAEPAKCEPDCRSSCGKTCMHSPPHYLQASNRHGYTCPILKHGPSTPTSMRGARNGTTHRSTIKPPDGFSGRRGPCNNAWPCGCMKHAAVSGWGSTGYATRVDGSKPQAGNSCRARWRTDSNRCAATMPNPMWSAGYGYSAATKNAGGRGGRTPGSARSASGRHPACTGCSRCVGCTSNNNSHRINAKATTSTHRSKNKVKTNTSRRSPSKRKVSRAIPRASNGQPSVRQASVDRSTWDDPVSAPRRQPETTELPKPSSDGIFGYFRRTFGKLTGL